MHTSLSEDVKRLAHDAPGTVCSDARLPSELGKDGGKTEQQGRGGGPLKRNGKLHYGCSNASQCAFKAHDNLVAPATSRQHIVLLKHAMKQ